ncbi:transcription antitermination factor NusB [Sneathiella glossodoripedis]|uniref:transcription antitermination factor NusB n=1 Tax=Sneathiella glossodoripedis TaxID=418853 RepID=UPI00046FD392|nr:transcription antitermination factor NusB [Sneathiella glossodoripedis]
MSTKSEKRGDKHSRRTLARFSAIQALYQMGMEDSTAEEVVEQFMSHRLGAEIDGHQFKDSDKPLFRDLVMGATERQSEIDEAIQSTLDKERKLEKLDLVMQACLRVAVYELMARIDTKAVVLITEYVGLARSFFTGNEPLFVNGILDRLARKYRAGEFTD